MDNNQPIGFLNGDHFQRSPARVVPEDEDSRVWRRVLVNANDDKR